MTGFTVCIVSAGRAEKISGLSLKLFPEAFVVVPPEQEDAYAAIVGKDRVIPQRGQGISAARNTVLDVFSKEGCVLMLDDDIQEVGQFLGKREKRAWERNEVSTNILALFGVMRLRGGLAFSCSPVPNSFYFNPARPISENLFLIGTFSGYDKDCPVRYDESLPLKEDYDFTVKVWRACGKAIRFNFVYCQALHYSNRGGCVDYRSDEKEKQAISILINRWPQYIRLNRRRKNEVLLRLK